MEAMIMIVLLMVANVMGAGMIVPQVTRLHRRRSDAGLSGVWVGFGIALNLWWLAYALQGPFWGMVPVSSIAAVLYGAIAWQLGRIAGRTGRRSMLIGSLTAGLAPLPFALYGGWTAAGIAIGSSYGLQFAPAVVAALRARGTTGISAATWAMALVEAAIWLIYGISLGDGALMLGGAGAGLMAATILARLAVVSRRVSPMAVSTVRPIPGLQSA